jgi:sigma-B regulation protein RsbU (phosphoserine phosphatase)
MDATGLPIGLFCDGKYSVRHFQLSPGDSLILYSDGITEAQDARAVEFGEERLIRSLTKFTARGLTAMAEGVLQDVAAFRDGRRQHDDITLLIVRRQPPQ